MDHDRLFKELLDVFFYDFVRLLLPDVASYLDAQSIERLDKELFADLGAGERLEADLVVKARFKGEATCFLVHVEHQAQPHAELPRRMFRYFVRLYERYGLPVYPVALLSYEKPRRSAPTSFQVRFPDAEVLDFRYRAIQLNRLDWRTFLSHDNPVASALMARMHIATGERAEVKLQCLRLLASLRLDPARMDLIAAFVDAYLPLGGAEREEYSQRLQALLPSEMEVAMKYMNSWKREGLEEGLELGRVEGMSEVLLNVLSKRFGEGAASLKERLQAMPTDRLLALSGLLFDLRDLPAVEAWLAEGR